MADDATVCVRVRIGGRVQGVWFRAWTEQTARSLGLSGWVRNRRDGSVEAVFQGRGDAVRDMVARCHEGPEHANVVAVEETAEPPGTYSGFEVRASH